MYRMLVMWRRSCAQCSCWHCIDAGPNIRSDTLTWANSEPCVYSKSLYAVPVWTLCQTIKVCFNTYIYVRHLGSCATMAASFALNRRNYEMLNTIKWLARTQHTDKMSMSGITGNCYDDMKFSILFTQKPYFASYYYNTRVYPWDET